MKRNLVDAKSGEVVTHVVIAVSVFLAQAARQRIQNAESREGKQTSIRYFVETMAVGVVSAQRQAGKLLGYAGLQAGIVAACTGAEFIHAAAALIERLLIGKRREASIADGLISVQLNLVWLMHSARAHIIDAQRTARS